MCLACYFEQRARKKQPAYSNSVFRTPKAQAQHSKHYYGFFPGVPGVWGKFSRFLQKRRWPKQGKKHSGSFHPGKWSTPPPPIKWDNLLSDPIRSLKKKKKPTERIYWVISSYRMQSSTREITLRLGVRSHNHVENLVWLLMNRKPSSARCQTSVSLQFGFFFRTFF